MRTVVNTQEVAHLWANQSQDHARNPGESVFFSGDTIYSYGHHFPMARHVNGAVLITTDRYSITTAKHQNWTTQACHHLDCYEVANVEANDKPAHRANLDDMRERYEALILKASRARKYGQYHLNDAETLRQRANDYSALFKLRIRIKPADVESIARRAAAQAKKEKAAQRKREQAQRAQLKIDLVKWRKGEIFHLPQAHLVSAALRINGAMVETSQGASFPVTDALQALPLVFACVEQDREWQRNGEQIRLGSYRLDHISPAGTVKAGCHTVQYPEVLRLSEALRGLQS